MRRYEVEISWQYSLASGTVTVVVEAESLRTAFGAALERDQLRLVTEGGAGVTSVTMRPTSLPVSPELDPETGVEIEA